MSGIQLRRGKRYCASGDVMAKISGANCTAAKSTLFAIEETPNYNDAWRDGVSLCKANVFLPAEDPCDAPLLIT